MKWRDEDIATALYFEIEVGREYMDHVYGSERISMAHVKFQRRRRSAMFAAHRPTLHTLLWHCRATS